ncbi:hypothetical protein [Xanthomonas translucens]|uniref:hypothetical protein n=1 Tax=Xanthomonas campestris pv. translucens TaxID=343 RepID=UPI0012D9A919|nr:hypothetical protein [Xanthomonas translucens]
MASIYYLPLTRDSAKNFIESGSSFAEPIEAAAMFVALTHLKKRQTHTQLERLMGDVFPLFRSHPEQGLEQLVGMRSEFEENDSENFFRRLLATEVALAPDAAIKERRWLAPNGNYSFEFQKRCIASREDYEVVFYPQADEDEEGDEPLGEFEEGERIDQSSRHVVRLTGTRDQAVMARMVASAPDERFGIEAYAGTGKTFLTHALRDHLPRGFTYVVAHAHQGFAFNSHVAASSKLRFLTLNQLADQLAQSYAKESGIPTAPRTGRSEYSFDEQAQMCGVGEIGGASASVVIQKLYRVIWSWCASDDIAISENHFRRVGIYDRKELSIYTESASRLWKAMFSKSPRGGQAFDIWDSQIAKWLELKGAAIAEQRGALLVDEAHDLPHAWRRLFDSYQGGCILLSDPHQRLRGKVFRSERAQSTRMVTSLRTGVQAADIIEKTLRLCTERLMPDFISAGDHVTHIMAYSNVSQLPETGLRLFGNEWAMLEVALRRAAANSPFRLLPTSRQALKENIRKALVLFDGRFLGSETAVNGQRDWDGLATKLHRQGLTAIVRMFERGFDEGSLAKLLAFEAKADRGSLILGLIDHSKNQEHDVVALSICCYEDAAIRRAFDPVHASYLGMTRARHELWIPGDSLDRLTDLAASVAA